MTTLPFKDGDGVDRQYNSGYKLRVLDDEIARQLGLRCRDCGGKKVVYAISKPLSNVFPEGAYCYLCLRTRVIRSRIIPFPIPENLLNNLKRALGLPITAAPVKFTTKEY